MTFFVFQFNSNETQATGPVYASHLTPVKRYEDFLTFNFETDGPNCKVRGYSTSGVWYAVLDYGTNYCNLRNLIDGTGMSSSANFNEQTSTDVCTQYDKIDCTRF